MPGQSTLDRILVAAVTMLAAAFAFGAMSAYASPASADQTAGGKRDDDAFELVAKDDDDDDDDTALAKDGSRSRDGSGDRSRSRDRDSGSNSRTGTTRGTGPSRSRSNSR